MRRAGWRTGRDVISRVVCAGVTRSTAPVAARSFRSAVARMRSCSGHIRQEARVAARCRQRRRLFGRAHPQHHLVAGDGGRVRERRSPGAGSGDADGLNLRRHFIICWPMLSPSIPHPEDARSRHLERGSSALRTLLRDATALILRMRSEDDETRSSGQPISRLRSRLVAARVEGPAGAGAGADMSSMRPRRRRSRPAQAIMAPLSPHSASGGATSLQTGFHRKALKALAHAPGSPRRRRRPRGGRMARDLAEGAQAHPGAVDHHVDDRGLEAGAEIGDVAPGQRRDLLRLEPQGGLQAGQRKIRLLAGPASGGAGRSAPDCPSRPRAPHAARPDSRRPRIFATLSKASPMASSMVVPRRT